MSIDEVEALNGKPFNAGGFGDMDRGTVVDWNGGKLAATIGDCEVFVQFTHGIYGMPLDLDDPLQSEGPYLSSEPTYRELGARIGSITIRYPYVD